MRLGEQEPGTLVVTFPGAYHCGFNLGFNCAEAVNFAPAEWLHYRQEAVARNRDFRRTPLLSPESLLLRVGSCSALLNAHEGGGSCPCKRRGSTERSKWQSYFGLRVHEAAITATRRMFHIVE